MNYLYLYIYLFIINIFLVKLMDEVVSEQCFFSHLSDDEKSLLLKIDRESMNIDSKY